MAGDNDENGGEGSSSMAVNPVMEEKPIEEKKLTTEGSKKKKKKKGVLSRIWSGVFGARKDDIERRLERITKEETTILNRMRRRAHTWGQRKRQIILFCVTLELIAVGYAIATAKTLENWKIRAFRVLPMFLLPALSYFMYSALAHFINMREQKDNKTLENLRVERQTKIDELKEKTNYYITQQLIQRYDTDPAAKAAAAQVLASKLGTDSGLKFFLENETRLYGASAGKSSDAEASAQSGGLRNRKQAISTAATSVASTAQHSNETTPRAGSECGDNQFQFIEHYQASQGGQTAGSGGWLSRIAALLVGEDPTQCYALICGNCHMHNGLASKEDFPYVTYICPHCQLVNGPKNRQENPSAPTTPNMGSMNSTDLGNANGSSDSALRNYIERSFSEAHPPLAPDRADKTDELAERHES